MRHTAQGGRISGIWLEGHKTGPGIESKGAAPAYYFTAEFERKVLARGEYTPIQ
jgi:hypothetical protein